MIPLSAADLAHALGGHRHAGYWAAKCPAHDDQSPSLSISEGKDGRVLVKCHRGCTQLDVIEALRSRGLWPEREEQARPSDPIKPKSVKTGPTDVDRSIVALKVWDDGIDPLGTPVEAYLHSRGCGGLLPEMAGRVIRYHPDCWFGEPEKRRHPAMLALFRDIRDDEPRAIHRIAIARDGTAVRRDGKNLKMMLGPAGGSAIKLSADEDVTLGLGITEGIETGLSIIAVGWRPVWALGAAGAIQNFPVLSGIEALTIFADNDRSETGEKAAQACAAVWRSAGLEARIFMPRGTGRDWADEVLS